MKRIKVELKSSFSEKNDIINKEYSWLIVANGCEVGHADLIRENFTDDFLVLDMEVNEENKKIRKKAINKISELNIDDLILMKHKDSYLPITR